MADSNKALEMGPGGWRYYGMLPHRELTNGAWGPREWSLNHMGLKNNNKLYENSREKDGNVKQACLKDQKHSTSREAVFSTRLLHCCLRLFWGIFTDSMDCKKGYGV